MLHFPVAACAIHCKALPFAAMCNATGNEELPEWHRFRSPEGFVEF